MKQVQLFDQFTENFIVLEYFHGLKFRPWKYMRKHARGCKNTQHALVFSGYFVFVNYKKENIYVKLYLLSRVQKDFILVVVLKV